MSVVVAVVDIVIAIAGIRDALMLGNSVQAARSDSSLGLCCSGRSLGVK